VTSLVSQAFFVRRFNQERIFNLISALVDWALNMDEADYL